MAGNVFAFGNNGGGIGDPTPEIIEVTLSNFNTLASGNELTFPATYKITDIQNGLYIDTLSASTFSPTATLSFLAPDYTLHTQYHHTDGAIANGATVTWGGFYWTNISGGSVTPDLPDEVDIDTDLTQFSKLAKSTANGYVEVILMVTIDDALSIVMVTDNYENTFNNFILSNFGITYENTVINNNAAKYNKGWVITNSRGDELSIFDNNAISTPIIKRCNLASGQLIINNEGVGTLAVTYIEDSQGIQGQHLHLSYIKNISVVGNSTVDESELNNLSYQENISITGDNNFIASGYLDSSSFEKNITIVGDGNEFNSREYLYDSGIDNFDITCDNFLFASVRLEKGSVLSNFTTSTNGRKIVDFHVSDKSIDLTGFDRDIQGERIVAGSGYFTITHNFTTSPLNNGSSVFYNLIPSGARITSIQAIGNSLTGGGGATLAFGLETDAPNLIAADTLANVNSGKTYSGFSAAATANRSLAITAGVANVTGGSVTVRIELIV